MLLSDGIHGGCENNVVLLIVMVLMLGDVVEHPLRDER